MLRSLPVDPGKEASGFLRLHKIRGSRVHTRLWRGKETPASLQWFGDLTCLKMSISTYNRLCRCREVCSLNVENSRPPRALPLCPLLCGQRTISSGLRATRVTHPANIPHPQGFLVRHLVSFFFTLITNQKLTYAMCAPWEQSSHCLPRPCFANAWLTADHWCIFDGY